MRKQRSTKNRLAFNLIGPLPLALHVAARPCTGGRMLSSTTTHVRLPLVPLGRLAIRLALIRSHLLILTPYSPIR